MYKILFSRTTLELFVSMSITKVIGDIIKNNVVAVTPWQKVMRFTGNILFVSIISDHILDHVDRRVAAAKIWWENQRNDRPVK